MLLFSLGNASEALAQRALAPAAVAPWPDEVRARGGLPSRRGGHCPGEAWP